MQTPAVAGPLLPDFSQNTASSAQGKPSEVAEPFSQSVEEWFLDWAAMKPEERVRKEYLDKNGLSEADLAALPADLRAQHEETIAQEIREMFHGKNGLTGENTTAAAASPQALQTASALLQISEQLQAT